MARGFVFRYRQKQSRVPCSTERVGWRRHTLELLEPRLALAATPLITEFMASNGGTVRDGDGNSSDWIEIWNPTNETINLAGWHLTDNANNLNKWTFPNAPQSILASGAYLLIFASGQSTETYIDAGGFLHTDFALSAEGEFLGLTDPNEQIVHAYSPKFPAQVRDVSYGLLPSGSTLTLIDQQQTTQVLVPTNNSLDANQVGQAPAWTLPGFDASGWISSASGVGVGYDSGGGDIINVPNGTILPGGPIGFDLTDPDENGLDVTLNVGGPIQPGEEEFKALDNDPLTKWLSFAPAGTHYEMRFNGGIRHAVNGYTLTSANDAPARDPYSWTLSGSNDGINWTAVDTRTAQDFTSRHQTRLYEFSNSSSYEYYRFDFLTEFGATGQNSTNSIQLAEIELLTTGSINYDELIDVDVQAEWEAARTSVYQRIEFDVDDPASLTTLLLEMQYDDGFVAYLNGTRVAAAFAPNLPNFNSQATGSRDDSDSLIPESFNLTPFLGSLVEGTNVLAIHLLNIDDTSSDLVSRPSLTASRASGDGVIEAYMLQATPGSTNSAAGVSLGPIVQNVTENPPRPGNLDNLVITAEVSAAGASVAGVTLYYRVMFGAEVAVAMNDQGIAGDAVAGDGIYSGIIPHQASTNGEMVRWYVVASDTVDAATRYPLFLNPTDSPRYLGTVVQQDVSNTLPVFEYFVENTAAEGTEAGTRAAVYFHGEFYDNVFVRRRGGFTTQGRKFEFNRGYPFLFDPNEARVDEINLNERGSEPTYMRQVMSWDIYAAAGVPASISQAWYVRRNDAHLDVRIFVEQPDDYLLRRVGLDDEGAFYKIGADGIENSVTSSTTGVRKRTRKTENNSDLLALVNGVNPNNPNRAAYVFDNVDIAGVINYIAATSIIHDNDHLAKNYHLYRDTEGSGQWTFIPWDKDLTLGLNWGISGVVGNLDPYSHPFFGDSDHRKVDNRWNRLVDAVIDIPEVKEMLVRRLRTLMDQFLLPPGSTEPSWIENRVEELRAALQPHLGSSSWTNNVNLIVNEYLVERRQHLYVNHSINNPGYPDNAGIPDAQVGNPTIEIAHVEHKPASGIRDEEYLVLHNPNNTAVDISYWRIEGDITHTMTPGTVIPAGGYLYLSPDVPTFLARTTGPRGNQGLFVQGNYSGNLANEGGVIQLVAADNTVIDEASTILPGDYNYDQVVDELDYLVWKGHFGSTTQLAADGNGDGIVNMGDFLVWRNNLGATTLPPAAAVAMADEIELVAPIATGATDLEGENEAEVSPFLSGWSVEVLAIAQRPSDVGLRPALREVLTSTISTSTTSDSDVRLQERRFSATRRASFDFASFGQQASEESNATGEDLFALDLAFETGLDPEI